MATTKELRRSPSMRLAVMQPYLLPYLGYWQLIHASDKFVIYDDVNYIPRGWINRNRLLVNGQPVYITLPLRDSSQNKKICQMQFTEDQRAPLRMLRTIELAYRRAPGFSWAFPCIEHSMRDGSGNLAEFLAHQIDAVCRLLGIQTEIVMSSRIYGNAELTGVDRILDLCRRNGATEYLNLPGGRTLYQPVAFKERGVKLGFISTESIAYRQIGVAGFVPNLSIVDVLMCLGKDGVRHHLTSYGIEQ
jgi:hypothetical protein